jgi:coproporphyrinogen III oxidase-like Fe-S oxidoreductase
MDRLLDAVMLQLRLGQGLDLDSVAASHGAAAADAIRRAVRQHEASGLVKLATGPDGGTRCRLTDPEGFLMSNDIISDVFAALDSVQLTN